jgi:hypothetical protein
VDAFHRVVLPSAEPRPPRSQPGRCRCFPSRSACPPPGARQQDSQSRGNGDISGRLMISRGQRQASKAPSRGRCRCIQSPSACILPSQQDSQSRGNGDISGRLMISHRQRQASKAPSRGRCRCIQSPGVCLLPSQQDSQSRGNGDASGRLMISPRQGQASKAPSRGGVDVSSRLVLVSCQAKSGRLPVERQWRCIRSANACSRSKSYGTNASETSQMLADPIGHRCLAWCPDRWKEVPRISLASLRRSESFSRPVAIITLGVIA